MGSINDKIDRTHLNVIVKSKCDSNQAIDAVLLDNWVMGNQVIKLYVYITGVDRYN